VAIIPFGFATDTNPSSDALLCYDLRLDLIWTEGAANEGQCLVRLRRFFDDETLDSTKSLGGSLRLDLEVFCCALRRVWKSEHPHALPLALSEKHSTATFVFEPSERKRLESAVCSLKDSIAAGQFYLANLTTVVDCPDATPADSVVMHLKRWCSRPSRFGWFIKTPEWSIESYSPERFFSRNGQRIQTEPIKGTRPLKPTHGAALADEDLWRAARELWHSEKERCEQHLVTDLLRNDLAAVCKPGTVQVTSPLEVRFCSGLAQMTTVIQGDLLSDLPPQDLLKGLLPAGSVTGAPKRAVCRALELLETQPRGLYCGLCIDVESPFKMDATLLIRTLFTTGRRVWAGTGAGITALSCPKEEVLEMELKMTSFLARCGWAEGPDRPRLGLRS
jgi:anthranilate/para-aminobenzoate synthase component I